MEHAHDFLQIVNGTAWANGAHPPDFAVQLQERTMRCRLSFDENIAPPQEGSAGFRLRNDSFPQPDFL